MKPGDLPGFFSILLIGVTYYKIIVLMTCKKWV